MADKTDKTEEPDIQLDDTPREPKEFDKKYILYGVLVVWAIVVIIGLAFVVGDDKDESSTQSSIELAEQKASELAEREAETDEKEQAATLATVGYSAPDFSVQAPDGKTIGLEDFEGEPVMIEFIATWCPHCQKMAPRVRKALKAVPTDYLMIGAAAEPDAKVIGFHEKYELPGSVGFDDKELTTIKMYRGNSYPTFAFLDADHKVVYLYSGEMTVGQLKGHLKSINK